MKLHLYRFEDAGGVLVLEELLLLAQDGRLENVVDVLVPGPGEHGQHHLVAVPVLGQGDDLHLCQLVSLAAHLLDLDPQI